MPSTVLRKLTAEVGTSVTILGTIGPSYPTDPVEQLWIECSASASDARRKLPTRAAGRASQLVILGADASEQGRHAARKIGIRGVFVDWDDRLRGIVRLLQTATLARLCDSSMRDTQSDEARLCSRAFHSSPSSDLLGEEHWEFVA